MTERSVTQNLNAGPAFRGVTGSPGRATPARIVETPISTHTLPRRP